MRKRSGAPNGRCDRWSRIHLVEIKGYSMLAPDLERAVFVWCVSTGWRTVGWDVPEGRSVSFQGPETSAASASLDASKGDKVRVVSRIGLYAVFVWTYSTLRVHCCASTWYHFYTTTPVRVTTATEPYMRLVAVPIIVTSPLLWV